MATLNFTVPTAVQRQNMDEVRDELIDQAEIIEAEFVEFLAKVDILVDMVRTEMQQTMELDPVLLQKTLVKLTAIAFSVGQGLADAEQFKDIYEMIHWTPKRQAYSEADRKLYTQTKSIRQRYAVDRLSSAEERLEKRVTVCQSLLKRAIPPEVSGEGA